MRTYLTPSLDIQVLTTTDVLTTSTGFDTDNTTTWQDSWFGDK